MPTAVLNPYLGTVGASECNLLACGVSMWLHTCIALLSPAVFSQLQHHGDR